MGRLRLPRLKSRLMFKSHLRLSLRRQSLIHESLQNLSIPLGLQIDKNMELGRPALSRGTFFHQFNLIPIHHLMHPPSLPATIQAHLKMPHLMATFFKLPCDLTPELQKPFFGL